MGAQFERALALQPEHLSLYCLTIEENTSFYRERLRGKLQLPDEDSQVAMYDLCCERLSRAGFDQYEISNFAREGRECQHNLEYWSGGEYAAYGPGAVGSFCLADGRIRTTNLKHPVGYCDAIEMGRSPVYDVETLSEEILRKEAIMLGLRLNEGLRLELVETQGGALSRLVERDWVQIDKKNVRLTKAGRHFCSEVAMELM
jgi:oxygen-independent coproporphyrinogen-3 oxidase